MSPVEVTQTNRLLSLDTPLGQDVLVIERWTGTESVSGLFTYELELLADLQQQQDQKVIPEDLLGKDVTITLELAEGDRYFNGIVKRFIEGHRDDRFAHYRAEVVPWLWVATLKSNCRIFQNLTTLDIIKQIFDGLKSSCDSVQYRDATTGSYVSWDYCVQYRETDFNFVSRLMEQEGIFYYFEHDQGQHTLVLADSNTAFPTCADQPKARYVSNIGYAEREDVILHFQKQQEVRPGKYSLRDYHFELPSKTLEKNEPTTVNVGNNASLEMYDYPGDYVPRFNQTSSRLGDVESMGQDVAKLRMMEEEVAHQVHSGKSDCRAFYSGCTFELTGHPAGMDGKYIIVQMHQAVTQSPGYMSDEESTEPYQSSIVCLPYDVPFRPRRLTPKPVVQGPQTAIVCVKDGEESWLDKYGRVRVQFHWDREGEYNENSTCWLRVSQPWAGNTWGAHFWPRVDQEVIVDFLEGDPDQPIVTGCVYNASQMPPYDLPDHYTVSGIKTRSSKNGSSSNFNELRFEDKIGDEQIFMNAEKDMDLRVENDSREFIGQDRHLIVKQNQIEKVEGDKHLHVVGDHKEKIEGAMSLTVTGDQKEQVNGGYSLQVSQSIDEKVGMKRAVDAGQEIHLKGGMTVIIEAGMQLSLKGPGGFVDIGPSGVTIQGTMVLINSGGAAGSGSGASPQSPDDPKDPDEADDGSNFTKM